MNWKKYKSTEEGRFHYNVGLHIDFIIEGPILLDDERKKISAKMFFDGREMDYIMLNSEEEAQRWCEDRLIQLKEEIDWALEK
ncbi:MAG: hypothetical protein NUV97_03130 [archaeon]|nr:hypothetical protein [archaeon]